MVNFLRLLAFIQSLRLPESFIGKPCYLKTYKSPALLSKVRGFCSCWLSQSYADTAISSTSFLTALRLRPLICRNIGYEIVDQDAQPQPITMPLMLTETFSNYMGVVSLPPDLTISVSNGILGDTIYFGKTLPNCPGNDDHEQVDQKFNVKIGQTTYNFTTVVHISRGYFQGTPKVDVTTTTP